MIVKEIYSCPVCDDTFDSYDAAFDCCPPDIGKTYQCGECGQDFEKILRKSGNLSVVKFKSSEYGLLLNKEQVVTWATEAAARQYISLM